MMLTLMPLIIMFTVGMIAGAVHAYRLIKKSRQASQRPGTLLNWVEMPLPSWKFEPEATTAILIHTLAVLVMGFLALVAASNSGMLDNPLFAKDAAMIGMVWFIQSGSLVIIGYHLGSLLLTFPMIVFRTELMAVAISEQGLDIGLNFLPWHGFSRFSMDRDAGILRFFSVFAPDLPSLTLKLPGSIPLSELEDTLHRFLPSNPSGRNRDWYRTKSFLVPTTLLACLPIIGLGWLASRLSQELALFLIAVLTVFLVFVGGKILHLFAFGILNSRTISQKQPPVA